MQASEITFVGQMKHNDVKNIGLRPKYENQDPKDGELFLGRVKSEETLMKARCDTDVQIVRRIWV